MKKSILLFLILLCWVSSSIAQQAAEIDSKSIKLSRFADLNAINVSIPSPQQGMMVYNISTASSWYYNGTSWVNSGIVLTPLALTSSGSSATLSSTATGIGNAFEAISSSGIAGYFWSNSDRAVYGQSSSGVGGQFISSTEKAVYATSNTNVAGYFSSTANAGLVGISSTGNGGSFSSSSNTGLISTGNSSGNGLEGRANGSGIGTLGSASSGYGGYFSSVSGYALITATGNVGIGTFNPNSKLEVNGFTKLGSDAPKIKIKQVSGSTSNTASGLSGAIPHGLTASNIISISVLVYSGTHYVPPVYDSEPRYKYNYFFDSSNIYIQNQASTCASSPNICDKGAVFMITYIE